MAFIQYSLVELKRLLVVRSIFVSIIVTPILLGISSSIFPQYIKKTTILQIDIILCLLFLGFIQINRFIMDKNSGLWEGLISCPITPLQVIVGRILASIFVFLSQLTIFLLIISIG